MGYPKKVVIHLNVHIKETLQLLPEGGMSDAYFPLNTGVKSLQSSTLNARMSLTESLSQRVFFSAFIAMYVRPCHCSQTDIRPCVL